MTLIRHFRERAGLSRAELSFRLRANQGVRLSQGAIYDIEQGESQSMDLRNAAAVARELSEVLGERIDVYNLFPDLAPTWRKIAQPTARMLASHIPGVARAA